MQSPMLLVSKPSASASIQPLPRPPSQAPSLGLKQSTHLLYHFFISNPPPRNPVCAQGPSGCGKTTLILVLSGRMPAAVSVFNDEHETVALTETRYRRKLGFVPQDDILHADLTVR